MSEITSAEITPIETLVKSATEQQNATAQEIVSKTQDTPKEETPKSESIFGKAVAKDEEGNFVWKSPTGSTIYKGKTESELFENMANGAIAKDEYIAKLTTPKLDSESITQMIDEQEKTSNIQFPDKNKIYQSVFTQNGLDPRMVNWSFAQWQEYAVNNSIPEFAIVELRQNVRAAQSSAETQYDQQNLKAINLETVDYEKDQIAQFAKDAGVQFTQEQFKNVVARAWEQRKNGFIVPGTITRLAANEILSGITTKQQSTVVASQEQARKQAEAEILAAQEKLKQLPRDTTSRTGFSKSEEKVSPNTRVAAQEALKMAQGYGR